jgi:hypothetical protein
MYIPHMREYRVNAHTHTHTHLHIKHTSIDEIMALDPSKRERELIVGCSALDVGRVLGSVCVCVCA